MPKSKKNKIVHLTQVKKKGKDHKEDLMKQVEQYVAQYKRVFVFNFDKTGSDRILHLRLRLKDHGRIFAGRNTIVTTALKSVSSKTKKNFDQLVKQIVGHRGLLFSNITCDKLIQILDDELPEFRDKLAGHAQISLENSDVANDEGDQMDEDVGTKATKQKKKRKAKKLQDAMEVEFIQM